MEFWQTSSSGTSPCSPSRSTKPAATACGPGSGDMRPVPAQGRSRIYIEGKLQTRKWQDKEGGTRYTTEIVAREMKMLDGKKDGQQQQQWDPQTQRMVPEADVPF